MAESQRKMNDKEQSTVNLSPYQKALGYLTLVCLFLFISAFCISLFIAHPEQILIYGFVIFIFVLTIGSAQLKVIYKQTQLKHWYQQQEIFVGLFSVCFIMVFPTISVFDTLFRAHPLRIVYYLEMATLFFWMFLSLFFMGLYLKNKFDEEKGEIEHPEMMMVEEKDTTKGQDQLKW